MYITSVARLRFDIVYYTSRLRNEQNRRLHNNSWLMTLPLWCELHWLPHATSSGIRCTFKQEIHVHNDYLIFPETITPDTFNPPWHELSAPIQDNLKLLLQEYESQFTKDEMTIGTTPLIKHDNRYGHCWPRFPKTLSYSYETLSVGEGWNWEVTHCQSNLHQLLQLVCTHYSSTKRWWRKTIGNRL